MKKFGGKLSEALEEIERAEDEKASDEALQALLLEVAASPTVSRLETLWRRAWGRGGFGFCPPLSQKGRGQLKALANQLGGTVTGALIVGAVEHWVECRKAVDRETAFDRSAMARPQPWFLVTHTAEVLAWLRAQQKDAESGSQSVSGGVSWGDLDG